MKTFLAALCGGLVVLIGFSLWSPGGVTTSLVAPHQSAFERVMQTGTLRCGYVIFEPAAYKDLKDGKLKGFMVDLVEDLAKRLNLKVIWAEEVGFGGMFAGLEANRYDAVCTSTWVSAGRSRVAEFSTPFLYSYVTGIVRADDTRFDKDISVANNSNVTLAVIDGDATTEIAAYDFPKAKTLAVPQMAVGEQIFLDVISGKADMTFEEATKIHLFSQKNPGKLKAIVLEKPLRVFPWAFAVAKGEHSLVSLLNGGLTEMLYSGEVEKIVKRHQPIPNSYYFFKPSLSAE